MNKVSMHPGAQRGDMAFESALLENLAILLDSVEAIREEAVRLDDGRTVEFADRVLSLLRAFVVARASGQPR